MLADRYDLQAMLLCIACSRVHCCCCCSCCCGCAAAAAGAAAAAADDAAAAAAHVAAAALPLPPEPLPLLLLMLGCTAAAAFRRFRWFPSFPLLSYFCWQPRRCALLQSFWTFCCLSLAVALRCFFSFSMPFRFSVASRCHYFLF